MSQPCDPLPPIIDALRDASSVCVVGHVRPDGDCVGSQLGLGLALRNAGKPVTIWNEDPLPRKLAFLDPEGLFTTPKAGQTFACVVATDCASYERLGQAGECIRGRRLLINLDHHASNTRYGDLNWVVPEVPSTGELVLELLKRGNWPVTPAIADCLFTAVSTDTGSFRYPTTRPETFCAAAELVGRGADLGNIGHQVYDSHPMSRFRLLRHMYRQSRLTYGDRIAYFWLRKGDYGRFGAEREESEGLIDHIRAIEPVIVACVFEELDDGLVRISLRSKSDAVDVNAIAQQFGGGGHKAAAGARLTGTRLAVQRRVLRALREAIDHAVPSLMLAAPDPFDGALLVDKPAGMTSHDVVDCVRRHLQVKKVGHCGTLDPMATGLLVILLGRATKLSETLMSSDKVYAGRIKFGESTNSFDADGELIASLPVPPLTVDILNEIATGFVGDLMQTPPMVSAVKVKGVPLYKLARKGVEVPREPRLVHIYSFRVTAFEEPCADFKVACTKGTYIRSLAHELGEKVGCGAHLAQLRRLASGDFKLDGATPLDGLLALRPEELRSKVVPYGKLTAG